MTPSSDVVGHATASSRRSDLLAAEHDLDGIEPGAVPARSIVVCTAPGTPSDPVADLLQRCGAGVPLEYFDLDAVAPPLVRRWRVINLDDYVSALHRHRSAGTGIFGLVLPWRHLRRVHHRVAGTKPLTAERTMSITRTIAPHPTFVLIRNAEPDHSAVALYVAERNGERVDYDPRVIAEHLALLQATERAWLQWFDTNAVRPVEVTVGPRWEMDPPPERLISAVGLIAPPSGIDHGRDDAPSPVVADLVRRFRADLLAS
jgi:LPS sulfotransferase NodH